MKKLAIGLLFLSGCLMAEQPGVPQAQPPSRHISYFDRIALRTQSPPVKIHKRSSDKPNKYIVTENKTTIVATRKFGE